MTEYKTVRLFGLPLRMPDAVILGGFSIFLLLAALFHDRLERPLAFIGRLILCGSLYLAAILLVRRLKSRGLRFLVRTASVQLMFLQTYLAARDLQRLFFDWNDDLVLAWEEAVFGVQPLVWIQNFHSLPLSEWMFFVYGCYIILYPILAAVIFFRHGEDANEDYLFHLGLINLLCGLGFILFPVAGPLRWDKVRVLLTEPLQSGLFGRFAEYIRNHWHAPGGTIPSPHCAVATVMWFMSWKYARPVFWALGPVILSLYVSTVYGRFHYVSDVITGIAVAVLTLLAAPALARQWNALAGRRPGGHG